MKWRNYLKNVSSTFVLFGIFVQNFSVFVSLSPRSHIYWHNVSATLHNFWICYLRILHGPQRSKRKNISEYLKMFCNFNFPARSCENQQVSDFLLHGFLRLCYWIAVENCSNHLFWRNGCRVKSHMVQCFDSMADNSGLPHNLPLFTNWKDSRRISSVVCQATCSSRWTTSRIKWHSFRWTLNAISRLIIADVASRVDRKCKFFLFWQ